MGTTPRGGETSMGGAARDFPSTVWTRLLQAAPEDRETRGALVGELARSYWKPVYAYLRSRWAKSNEDAKDLTQDFFVWLLEGPLLDKVDPARGRFRSLLRGALEFYVRNDLRKGFRMKRGGGKIPWTLDAGADREGAPEIGDPAGRTPEEVMDRTWKSEILARALQLLEDGYRREEKETYGRVFRDFFVRESGPVDYRELAARYAISEDDVSNYLRHAKGRFRQTVEHLVAETVRTEEDLRDEMKTLFGGLLG